MLGRPRGLTVTRRISRPSSPRWRARRGYWGNKFTARVSSFGGTIGTVDEIFFTAIERELPIEPDVVDITFDDLALFCGERGFVLFALIVVSVEEFSSPGFLRFSGRKRLGLEFGIGAKMIFFVVFIKFCFCVMRRERLSVPDGEIFTGFILFVSVVPCSADVKSVVISTLKICAGIGAE